MLIFDFLVAGGVVMIPLLGFSILSIALIVERLKFWFGITRRQKPLTRDVLRSYQHDPDAAILKLKQNIDLPIARIFLEALEVGQAPRDIFRLALQGATQAELPLLRRFNTIFDIIIAASPLLGLLGTVTGLIRTFASLNLGDVGQGSAVAVTGGISEALISTASGLVVALFVLLFAGIFKGFCRRQITFINEAASQLEVLYWREQEAEKIRIPSELRS